MHQNDRNQGKDVLVTFSLILPVCPRFSSASMSSRTRFLLFLSISISVCVHEHFVIVQLCFRLDFVREIEVHAANGRRVALEKRTVEGRH